MMISSTYKIVVISALIGSVSVSYVIGDKLKAISKIKKKEVITHVKVEGTYPIHDTLNKLKA